MKTSENIKVKLINQYQFRNRYVLELKGVFCVQNCSDLLSEKIVLVIDNFFEIQGWRLRIC